MHDPRPLARHVLAIETLTAEAFRPFGELIEAGAHAPHFAINAGFADRFDDLARIDTSAEGGRTRVSIFRTRPRMLPLKLSLVERHALGSQAFVPLAAQRLLVVVAPAGPAPQALALRCFLAGAGQGINLARGVWHHPLLALDAGGDYLVIDRSGGEPDGDCEELVLERPEVWIEA